MARFHLCFLISRSQPPGPSGRQHRCGNSFELARVAHPWVSRTKACSLRNSGFRSSLQISCAGSVLQGAGQERARCASKLLAKTLGRKQMGGSHRSRRTIREAVRREKGDWKSLTLKCSAKNIWTEPQGVLQSHPTEGPCVFKVPRHARLESAWGHRRVSLLPWSAALPRVQGLSSTSSWLPHSTLCPAQPFHGSWEPLSPQEGRLEKQTTTPLPLLWLSADVTSSHAFPFHCPSEIIHPQTHFGRVLLFLQYWGLK